MRLMCQLTLYDKNYITLFKGIKQGCPLSALLFIICAEYLCLTINKSNAMSGILLNLSDQPCEIRCTQYADDIYLMYVFNVYI